MNTIKDLILIKVNNRKCITARALIDELNLHNSFWSKSMIRSSLIELSEQGFIKEVEIVYENNTNDSILLSKGTRVITIL